MSHATVQGVLGSSFGRQSHPGLLHSRGRAVRQPARGVYIVLHQPLSSSGRDELYASPCLVTAPDLCRRRHLPPLWRRRCLRLLLQRARQRLTHQTACTNGLMHRLYRCVRSMRWPCLRNESQNGPSSSSLRATVSRMETRQKGGPGSFKSRGATDRTTLATLVPYLHDLINYMSELDRYVHGGQSTDSKQRVVTDVLASTAFRSRTRPSRSGLAW